jgi:hypothetical protein
MTREYGFDAACLAAGRIGKVLGVRLDRPVLIIGTGRCGTTLLVRILHTHPDLAGFPGEANELWHPMLEPFESTTLDMPPIEVDPERFTEVSMAHWPAGHGEALRDTFRGYHLVKGPSKGFFSKSAMVSFMIPKILEIFPDARIIHIFRSGPSVVASYFKKNFGKYTRFSYPETEYRRYCAKYWNDCILEIDRREKEFSLSAKGQFLEFGYEALCERPRAIMDDVAKFVGVAPERFGFDFSQVSCRNEKVENYWDDPDWAGLLELMAPGMRLKRYQLMPPKP